jgi:hypothetical protein
MDGKQGTSIMTVKRTLSKRYQANINDKKALVRGGGHSKERIQVLKNSAIVARHIEECGKKWYED